MNAQQVIEQFENLPPDEQQKVSEYIYQKELKNDRPINYSSETLEQLHQEAEEAKRGIDISPAFTNTEELVKWLKEQN